MKYSPPVIVLFLLGSISLGAQNTAVLFSFAVEDYPESQILESLRDGHRSQVRYEFRVFRKARGLAKIFGDKIIKEEESLYIARWDALNENYVVLVDESAEYAFKDPLSFLNFFLSVENRRMYISGELRDEDYLLCRWRIQPIKLVPPLTLMTLIKTDLQTISSWRPTKMERITR